MNKLQLIKLLEARGVTELEKGQSLGQAIRDTGGEATYDELLKVMQLCAEYYNTKLESMEKQVEKYSKELAEAEDDLLWLRCLEAAGVDNWEGHDIAVDMYTEQVD